MGVLADSTARERAITATGRNVVVTAGAGTGKTTLLVDRLLEVLVRRPHPVAVTEIVALTFTNKAANEMKIRLRDRLSTMRMLRVEQPPESAERRRDWERMRDLCARHALSKERLDELTGAALVDLEKSQIGTIHSFSAHLLRLYPIEGQVDPSFQEDEGAGFREFFEIEWRLWLDAELGTAGRHHDVWRQVLTVVQLEEVKGLTAGLAGELIPAEGITASVGEGAPSRHIRAWLEDCVARATWLRSTHPKATTLERMLDEAIASLGRTASATISGTRDTVGGGEILERSVPPKTVSWTHEDYAEAKRLVGLARRLRRCETGVLVPLFELLVPFARSCRLRFLEQGLVSFDGLLAKARDLLRDHPVRRRDVKSRFKAVLVDEFQDTDPVQYELILYLAEAAGQEAHDWRAVRLQPGKLFIVGDPKQSIYAFRRADMEAYDAVVEDCVLGENQAGERQTLCTNFRSHAALLGPLNAFFERLFPAESVKGRQPRHEPLVPDESGPPPLAGEHVQARLVVPEDQEADADEATRVEAEELARWLREDVIGRQEILDHGERALIRPKHIAVLLRTLTKARAYLDSLRRYEIPCLTDGEKYFYERQEIIDTINLLRAIANPHDRLAVAAVLRSTLGAVTDADVETLARAGSLDYRRGYQQEQSRDAALNAAYDAAGPVLGLMAALHREIPLLPLTEVMDAVFAKMPVRELAAATDDREQALANLLKLRDLTVELAMRPDSTLKQLVEELTRRALEPPEEPESPLTEEIGADRDSEGAVRLMSIHKAKGLEFPLVVLAGLHRGTDSRESRIMVQHDWTSGIVGVRAGELETVAGLYVGAKIAERQRAEQLRVLYVGMTRAKRRLVLSAGIPKKRSTDSLLTLIGQGLATDLESQSASTTLRLGGAAIPIDVVRASKRKLRQERPHRIWEDADLEVGDWHDEWLERGICREAAGKAALFMSPTGLTGAAKDTRLEVADRLSLGRDLAPRRRTPVEGPQSAQSDSRAMENRALLLGTLAHRVLEGWDFREDPAGFDARVARICRVSLRDHTPDDAAAMESELRSIFQHFAKSAPYDELRRARILGREIPFALPWPRSEAQHPALSPQHCIMEGAIDIAYNLDGRVWVADYKTDRVAEDELEERAEAYREQAAIYVEAVLRSLGLENVGCKLLFLRHGIAVQF